MSATTTEAPQNPLAEGLSEYRSVDPTLMVIFGGTGDLSQRKLLPALYNLARNRMLPAGFMLVAAALEDMDERQFREKARASIEQHSRTQPVDRRALRAFLADVTYLP